MNNEDKVAQEKYRSAMKQSISQMKFGGILLIPSLVIVYLLGGFSSSRSEQKSEEYENITSGIEASKNAETSSQIVLNLAMESKSNTVKAGGIVGAAALNAYSEYIKNKKYLEYSQFKDTAHEVANKLQLLKGYDEILSAVKNKYSSPLEVKEVFFSSEKVDGYLADGSYYGFEFFGENAKSVGKYVFSDQNEFEKLVGYFMQLKLQSLIGSIDCIKEKHVASDLAIVCSPHFDQVLVVHQISDSYKYGWLEVAGSFPSNLLGSNK